MNILKQKQCVLFIYSEYSKNYEAIRKVILKKGKKPKINTEDLFEFSEEDRDLIINRFDELLDLAKLEWKTAPSLLTDEERSIIECQLCGHRPLKEHFKIYNTINGIELIVGSSCIKTYNFMSPNGKDIKQIRREQEAQAALIRNENKIKEFDPNIIEVMKRYRDLNKQNIFLTKNLDKLVENYKSDYQKYDKLIRKKSGLNDKDLHNINIYYRKIYYVLDEVDEYIEFSTHDKYGISNNVWKWCDEYDKKLFERLKNNGRIDRNTIGKIKEPEFLNKFMIHMKPLLEKNNITIIKLKGTVTSVTSPQLQNIIVELDSVKFIENYKDFIFEKKDHEITTYDILNLSKVTDAKSLDVVLQLLYKRFIKNFNLRFSDANINEIAFKVIQTGKIYSVDYNQFVNKFLTWIMLEKSQRYHALQNEIEYFIKDSKLAEYEDDEAYMDHLELYGISKREFYDD